MEDAEQTTQGQMEKQVSVILMSTATSQDRAVPRQTGAGRRMYTACVQVVSTIVNKYRQER